MNNDILIGLILMGIGGIIFFSRKSRATLMRPGTLPERMPERMPEKMPERMPERSYEKPIETDSKLYEKTTEKIPIPTPVVDPTYSGWTLPPAGEPYRYSFENASRVYNLPKNLLARVAYQESHFRPEIINGTVKSNRGAVGIMQIVPRWHPDVNPLDPSEAIGYAAAYLNNLHSRLNSWPQALAAYNWGIGNLKNKGIENAPNETRQYVNSILNDIQFYQNAG